MITFTSALTETFDNICIDDVKSHILLLVILTTKKSNLIMMIMIKTQIGIH